MRKIRELESAFRHLADQHSEKLYHGTAISASDRRPSGQKGISQPVSGRKGAGINER